MRNIVARVVETKIIQRHDIQSDTVFAAYTFIAVDAINSCSRNSATIGRGCMTPSNNLIVFFSRVFSQQIRGENEDT